MYNERLPVTTREAYSSSSWWLKNKCSAVLAYWGPYSRFLSYAPTLSILKGLCPVCIWCRCGCWNNMFALVSHSGKSRESFHWTDGHLHQTFIHVIFSRFIMINHPGTVGNRKASATSQIWNKKHYIQNTVITGRRAFKYESVIISDRISVV